MNKDIIKRIIVDFQERGLPEMVSRQLKIKELRDTVIVITGARRSGKTYRTYQYIKNKIAAGVSVENICRLQFNDNRLLGLNDLNEIDAAYMELYPEKINTEAVYYIFDEIHRVSGWEDYVLKLIDNPLNHVVVTGSTSKLLSGDIASALRGKCYPHNLFPFSFLEYLSYKHIEPELTGSKSVSQIKSAFNEYLNCGGFSGLYGLSAEDRLEMLQNYWDTMLIKDIIEAHPQDRINIEVFERFAVMLVNRNACPMTVRPLVSELKNLGYQTSPDSIYRYLAYLKEAFMIYTVPFFTKSSKKIDLNYKKVYVIDWALADAVSSGEGMLNSRRLENLVFLHLKRQFNKVSYFKTRQGYEVDFVVQPSKERFPHMYQVAYNLDDKSVLDREVRSLVKAAEFLGSKRNYIITLDSEFEIDSENGVLIKAIPAYKWICQGIDNC